MATQLGSIKRVRRFPGFVVDGFNYQSPDVVAYFLTHFHADHTCGLHAGFKGPAPIYCTAVTAALLTNVMGVKPSLVCAVALNDTVQVQTADGANAFVTFLDANHCPGSATIHFRRRRGADDEDARTNTEKRKGVETREELEENDVVALHTGDFRAARCVREDPKLHALIRDHGPIGELYLDTTYCDPRWRFPDRKRACAAMAEIARAELRREPRTLFLVGSYSIGKERAVKAVARGAAGSARGGTAANAQAHGLVDKTFPCEDDERAVAEAAEEERTRARAGGVEHEHASNTPTPPFRVRVFPMGGGPPHETMARALRESRDPETGAPYFKAAVSFRPTGWSYRSSKTKDDGDANPKRETRVDLDAVDRDDASDDEHERGRRVGAFVRAVGRERRGDARVRRAVQRAQQFRRAHGVCFAREAGANHAHGERPDGRRAREDPEALPAPHGRESRPEQARALLPLRAERGGRERRRVEGEERGGPRRASGGSGSRDPRRAPLDVDPAELRQQVALLEEAAARRLAKSRKPARRTGDRGPVRDAVPARVRGARARRRRRSAAAALKYAQFRDKAHVESRLPPLGATVVHRASPKVTHASPRWRRALAEERRRQGQLERPPAPAPARPPASPVSRRSPSPRRSSRAAPERDDEKKRGRRPVRRAARLATRRVPNGGGHGGWVMWHWPRTRTARRGATIRRL